MEHSNMNMSAMAGSGMNMSGSGMSMTGSGGSHGGSEADGSMPGHSVDMAMDGTHEMHGMSSMGMMMMYFHTGISEFILFKQLLTSTKGEFAGACVAIFTVAVLYEGLKFLREELVRRDARRLAGLLVHGTPAERSQASSTGRRMCTGLHFLQTVLHALQISVSYLLMLVVMTYNAWLCLSVLLGTTTGYFFFGWRRTLVADNEHCH